MPLVGKAKADYQRSYMREYMRRKRGSVKTLVKTADVRPVKTETTRELTYEKDDYSQ